MDENKPQQNNKNGLKTIRTYMSDMADTVRQNEISVIKVALAEQNKHEREDLYRKAEGTPLKKFFWILGSLIFIGGAVYGFYFLNQEKIKKEIPPQIIKEESIISYDELSFIDGTNVDGLLEKIISEKNKISTLEKNNSIKWISLTKKITDSTEKISTVELFLRLGFTAPGSLVRSFSDSYMIGTYTRTKISEVNTFGDQPRLFIIFQPTDYESAYAGMLGWEKTLASDMFNLFQLETKESVSQLSARSFKDVIINNKDVRVLFNENNKAILYYLFIDKNNVVVADGQETIKEIISRLMIKNIKPL